MSTEKQLIRKYANRKLYHVGKATYVSMLELSDMVAEGVAVEVVDDVTGEDVTIEVLSRSLYERVKDRDRSVVGLAPRELSRMFGRVRRRTVE
jgi:polyhydroxyalkanoate synthesis regulator protein